MSREEVCRVARCTSELILEVAARAETTQLDGDTVRTTACQVGLVMCPLPLITPSRCTTEVLPEAHPVASGVIEGVREELLRR